MDWAKVALVVLVMQSVGVAKSPWAWTPPRPLAQRLHHADVALLVKYVDAIPPDKKTDFAGETSFDVLEVLKNGDDEYRAGATVRYPSEIRGEEDETYILLGTGEWAKPVRVSEPAIQYLKDAPGLDAPVADRLRYFLRFLEVEDATTSHDAFEEFAWAGYTELRAFHTEFSRETLREWLADPETDLNRIGLYSLLLGLVGNSDDAAYLEQRILEPSAEFRPGVDEMVAGYLILTGDDGLDVIDREKLANLEQPFGEVYLTMKSLEFMWESEPDRVSQDRLRASMRILLDRPLLADLVVKNLARWNDWSAADRMMELYNDEDFDNQATKRAIAEYFLLATRLSPDDMGAPPPETAARCAEHLAQLREIDPKTVKQAERFFFLVE